MRAASAIVMPRSSHSSSSASALAKSSGYACACDARRLAVAPDEPAADRVVHLAEHKPASRGSSDANASVAAATPVVAHARRRGRAARGIRHRRLVDHASSVIAFGWPGSLSRGAKTMSRLRERHRVACRRARAARRRRPVASMRRGRHPGPPSRARGPAARRPPRRVCRARCPVAPSEPYSVHVTRATRSSSPSSRRRVAKSRAARMGPTVWELEGPTPMENSSNAETYALTPPGYAPRGETPDAVERAASAPSRLSRSDAPG